MVEITSCLIKMDMVANLQQPCQSREAITLWWLGQAGFFISGAGINLLIDPYLSDHLARKYQGREFDHVRLTPAPVDPRDMTAVDYVLCTHRHGDHMDPESLPIIMKASERCRVVAPVAEKDLVGSLIPEASRTILVKDGDTLSLGPEAAVQVIASAHEDLRSNHRGEHHYLGYILRLGSFGIYHSGDCVPYPGLVECLRRHQIGVALLPVNGRDTYRSSRGVPGNFTAEEAVDLTIKADIPLMICHHFGMFEFNTVAQESLRCLIETMGLGSRVFVPQVGTPYQLRRTLPA